MADKRGDFTIRAVGGVAGLVASVITRKAMTAAWKKVTGKEPPTDPEHPETALAEAIGWAAVMGVAMSITRLLATRLATRRLHGPAAATTEDATADSASG